jgi:hypothetical protein
MSYDIKCLMLANHFLSSYRTKIPEEKFSNVASDLAEQIQRVVEDFLRDHDER